MALYKGFTPSYLRLGPWNIIVSTNTSSNSQRIGLLFLWYHYLELHAYVVMTLLILLIKILISTCFR